MFAIVLCRVFFAFMIISAFLLKFDLINIINNCTYYEHGPIIYVKVIYVM